MTYEIGKILNLLINYRQEDNIVLASPNMNFNVYSKYAVYLFRDSTLHSESFETVTSVPQSESEYSDGSSRYR